MHKISRLVLYCYLFQQVCGHEIAGEVATMFESDPTEVSTIPEVNNGSLTNGTASSVDLVRKAESLETGMLFIFAENVKFKN